MDRPFRLRPSAALSASSYGKGIVRYDRCKNRAMAFAPSEYTHIFTHTQPEKFTLYLIDRV